MSTLTTLVVTLAETLVATPAVVTTVAVAAATKVATTSKRSKGGLSVVLGPPFFVL